jgi:antitoxin MazE
MTQDHRKIWPSARRETRAPTSPVSEGPAERNRHLDADVPCAGKLHLEQIATATRGWLGLGPRDSLRERAGCAYIVITMKARLVRIGNSRGIRLPKAISDQVGLEDEVELRVEEQRLVIVPAARPRAGWAEAIQAMGSEPASHLDPVTRTRFDETEWQW